MSEENPANRVNLYTFNTGSLDEAKIHSLDAPRTIPSWAVTQIKDLLRGTMVTRGDNHHRDGALIFHPPIPLRRGEFIGKAVAWMMGAKEMWMINTAETVQKPKVWGEQELWK
jgi:hypothetical protein